jgi:large subunit ribosomal protein L15
VLTLNSLSPAAGARKDKKRVGRGGGSGTGKTAGRGHKGARSRAGYSMKPGFEGGQMPLHRRLPKRGFTNLFKKTYTIITLDDLDMFDEGTVITPQLLVDAGLLRQDMEPKILSNGEISKSLTVKIEKMSRSAKEKIVAAGGVVEEQ